MSRSQVVKPYRGVKLWDGDLVHSDLHEGQVLMERGQVSAVVDFENAGKGSRVQDLMTCRCMMEMAR